MIEALVKAIFWLIGKVSDIIILPIMLLLQTSLPDLTSYITQIEGYLDQYVWTTAAFVKRVMINFGVPQIVFTFIITWYGFKLAVATGVRLYALFYNLYTKLKP